MKNQEGWKLRADVRAHIARELHDTVAGHLQAMLVEMELMRRRGEAPDEIKTFQAATRRALGSLRELMYQLRECPEPAEAIRKQIESRLDAAVATRQSRLG